MHSPRPYWAPAVVLALSLLATGLATYSIALTSRSRDLARLSTAIGWTTNAIQERLQVYTCGLLGGAALFAAGEVPTADEFRKYAERLNLRVLYPGIQGFGFARRTLPGEQSKLVETMRQYGTPEFVIKPPGDRPEYFPIVYLEPLDRRNQEAIGYDMFSEPVRRAAMERARDGGEPAASGKVLLVQEIEPEKQDGFLLYVPVYAGGRVPAEQREKQARLLGFVYSPFRAGDFFSGIFKAEEQLQVQLEVYDGSTISPGSLMYRPRVPQSASHPRFETVRVLSFAGHQWTLRLQSTPSFESSSYNGLVPWVLSIGFFLSLILAAITAALARAHRDLQQAQAALKTHAENLEQAVAARTARLRETVAELEHMSYSIVHDLRAPLRAIQSFGGMLEEEAGPALSNECRDYVARMKTAANRMDALIRDVLSYAKVVQGDIPVYPVNLTPLVRGILETYPAFQSSAADIELDPSLPSVLGNEAALTQCFSNLLSNAIRFAKPGSKPKVSITGRTDDRRVRVCVADEGIGIPRDVQGKVFGMFQRLDTAHEGTGIGLAIVRKATERMGGRVWVESEPGKYTRFYLELPAAKKDV